MKELDLECWNYEDGSVGACINNIPGDIWAKDRDTLVAGFRHLGGIFVDDAERRQESSATFGVIDLQAQAAYIDGRLCLRWLAVPGFGMDFADEDELKAFVAGMMIKPTEQEYQAKLN